MSARVWWWCLTRLFWNEAPVPVVSNVYHASTMHFLKWYSLQSHHIDLCVYCVDQSWWHVYYEGLHSIGWWYLVDKLEDPHMTAKLIGNQQVSVIAILNYDERTIINLGGICATDKTIIYNVSTTRYRDTWSRVRLYRHILLAIFLDEQCSYEKKGLRFQREDTPSATLSILSVTSFPMRQMWWYHRLWRVDPGTARIQHN